MSKKISQLPQQASPTTADKVPLVSGGITDYALLSDLITLFFNNIPTGAHSDVTRWSETGFDFVASGLVWSGDSYGVNKNASMTTGIIYINGRRISISAVTARVFTASKDTYIDVLDNTDGTGTLVYTEVTNNAASPALAANSVRIGIIVTGATTIAAVGSVNQGQESKILPIASSIAYSVTDSLGNLICGRDSARKVLGFRQSLTTFTLSASQTTHTQVTGLSCPVIVPTGRKIEAKTSALNIVNASANQTSGLAIWDGVVVSGTKLEESDVTNATANGLNAAYVEILATPAAAGLRTFNTSVVSGGLTNVLLQATATSPAYILVELG